MRTTPGYPWRWYRYHKKRSHPLAAPQPWDYIKLPYFVTTAGFVEYMEENSQPWEDWSCEAMVFEPVAPTNLPKKVRRDETKRLHRQEESAREQGHYLSRIR